MTASSWLQAVLAVVAGVRGGDGGDELHRRQRRPRLARVRPGDALELARGARRRADAQDAELVVLRRAVEGDDAEVGEDPPPAAGQLGELALGAARPRPRRALAASSSAAAAAQQRGRGRAPARRGSPAAVARRRQYTLCVVRMRSRVDRAPSVEARSRALDATHDSGPGTPAAPAHYRLRLLPSGSDLVRGRTARGTRTIDATSDAAGPGADAPRGGIRPR